MIALIKSKIYFTSTLLVLCLCIISNSAESLDLESDPEWNMDAVELITSKGYPVEKHEVTTTDGYVLTLLRIPSSKKKHVTENCTRTPVLVMHGILTDAGCWVMNYPNQSLGFILADKGYDVWLGNMRQTKTFSRHQNFSSDSPKFWNFGLEEIAMYDLPAMIDGVLKVTGEKQLIYVGYSQGTTEAFILLSQNPEYNKKIKLFVALAPVTNLQHMTNRARTVVPFTDVLVSTLKLLGMYELSNENAAAVILSRYICATGEGQDCMKGFLGLFELDKQHINMTRFPIYEKELYSSTSVRVLHHFSQLVESEYFQKFDYGPEKNIEVYKKETPPVYDVSKITTPTILIWAEKDSLSDPRDVKTLQKQLRSVVWTYRVPRKSFEHLDYVLALDVKEALYDKLFTKVCNLVS